MWKKIGWTSLLLLVTVIVIGAGLTIRHQRNTATPKRAIPEVTQTGGVHVTIKQKDAFIRSIAVPAVRNFQRNRQILPSVVIAQAALESQFGTSDLYSEAHNPFGVKGTYQGQSVTFYTREVENGKSVRVLAQFRKYPSVAAAITDHNRLVHRKFVRRTNLLSYRTTTRLLQENGYATDPHYAAKLNRLIVKYHLGKYDLKALNDD